MRWAEMAAFTPVMRTHEGNRPRDNLQLDQDPEVLAHFARMTQVYVHLVPYLKFLVAEASTRGLPVQRPLFLHFEADARTYAIQDAYLYGPDLLVAPVWQVGQVRMEHLSSGRIGLDSCLVWPHLRGWAGGNGCCSLRPAASVPPCRKPVCGVVCRVEGPLSYVACGAHWVPGADGGSRLCPDADGLRLWPHHHGGVGLTGLLSLADAAMIVSVLSMVNSMQML